MRKFHLPSLPWCDVYFNFISSRPSEWQIFSLHFEQNLSNGLAITPCVGTPAWGITVFLQVLNGYPTRRGGLGYALLSPLLETTHQQTLRPSHVYWSLTLPTITTAALNVYLDLKGWDRPEISSGMVCFQPPSRYNNSTWTFMLGHRHWSGISFYFISFCLLLGNPPSNKSFVTWRASRYCSLRVIGVNAFWPLHWISAAFAGRNSDFHGKIKLFFLCTASGDWPLLVHVPVLISVTCGVPLQPLNWGCVCNFFCWWMAGSARFIPHWGARMGLPRDDNATLLPQH